MAGGEYRGIQRGASTVTSSVAFNGLREDLRHVLAQERKWIELPDLLDQLDRIRRQGLERSSDASVRTRHRRMWVNTFSQTILESASSKVPREQVHRTARIVWHWLPDQDPVALARGDWDSLPRSYA